MKGIFSQSKSYLILISLLFLLWAGAFIFNSSFIGIDGKRYFSLVDDAMISMRYAWNFSHGKGLVWNEGTRVEGITNMLMTLYMSIGTRAFDKITAVLFVQCSGMLFLLVIAYFTMRIGQKIYEKNGRCNQHLYTVMAFLMAFSYYPLLYWTLMGMETGLLALCLLWAVLRAMSVEGSNTIHWLLPVLLGCAFLTRPDALIAVGLIMFYRAAGIRGQKGWIRVIGIELLIFSLFFIGLSGFRLFYYGELVPNTYTLKIVGIPLRIRLLNGLSYIRPFLPTIALPMLLVVLGIIQTYRQQQRSRLNAHLLLLSLSIAAIVYQIWIGGDNLFYWRMFAPFMPLLLVQCLDSINALLPSISSLSNKMATGWEPRYGVRPSFLRRVILVGSMLLVFYVINSEWLGEMVFSKEPRAVYNNIGYTNTAIAIQEVTTPGATVAVFWAGIIPYFTGLEAIDMLGKSDQYIASRPPKFTYNVPEKRPFLFYIPGHCKYDLLYSVTTFLPTYLEFFRWDTEDISAFVWPRYAQVSYKGVPLLLRKESEHVLWDKLDK